MTNKKSNQLNKKYIKRAKLLKKHKLIKYDLRKNLTPQQKAAITRLWVGKPDSDDEGHHDGWGQYVDNKDVIFRTVSNKRIKELKALGYKTRGNRVYIDSEGFKSVHIKGDRIIKGGGEFKEKIDLLVPRGKIFDEIEKRLKRKVPKGEFLTLRIGDNGMFREEVLTSYESLLNYLSNWSPRKDFSKRDDLISKMSIVRFTGNFKEL